MTYIRNVTQQELDSLDLNLIPYEFDMYETGSICVPKEHVAMALFVMNRSFRGLDLKTIQMVS